MVSSPFNFFNDQLNIHPEFNQNETPRKYPSLVEYADMVEDIRAQNLGPKDHIPQLVDIVPAHLDFVHQGLVKQGLVPGDERMQIFERFREEAVERLSNDQVDYYWWVCFNFRLSILLTPEEHRTDYLVKGYEFEAVTELYENNLWQKHEEVEKRLSPLSWFLDDIKEFPEVFYIPTIDGDLEVDDFNQLFRSGIYPMGMIDGPIWADGTFMYPDYFFRHDGDHAYRQMRQNCSDGPFDTLHDYYSSKVEALGDREKESVKFWYFISTHDSVGGPGASWLDTMKDIWVIKNERIDPRNDIPYFTDGRWYGNILPSWIDKTSDESTYEGLEKSFAHFVHFMKGLAYTKYSNGEHMSEEDITSFPRDYKYLYPEAALKFHKGSEAERTTKKIDLVKAKIELLQERRQVQTEVFQILRNGANE